MLKRALLVLGAALLLGGCVAAFVESFVHAGAARTAGIVVAFRGVTPAPVQKGPPGEPRVSPVIEFKDAAGRTHRLAAGWASTTPAHALGDRVPVLYLPSDPVVAVIDSFTERWGMALVLAAAGTISLLLGLFTGGRASRNG